MPRPFLTARWEHLVFLNYPCPPSLLQPFVPAGTTLDSWAGTTYISLVGFLFHDTRVRGLGIPCHRTFEEVNLRFYVQRTTPDGELRRAVVFLRELVPRRAIAAVARRFYNEPYIAVPMSNAVDVESASAGLVAYFWSFNRKPYGISAKVSGLPQETAAGSQAEFITEHYWGYTRQVDGTTLEYKVEHPRWPVWTPSEWVLDGPMAELYGPEFGSIIDKGPASVFIAPGSEVSVSIGQRLAATSG